MPQEDILLPTFTVKETLLYAALLRLPQKWARRNKTDVVDRVLEELNIAECRDVVVGSVEKPGISGGQRRRVSIGLEVRTWMGRGRFGGDEWVP